MGLAERQPRVTPKESAPLYSGVQTVDAHPTTAQKLNAAMFKPNGTLTEAVRAGLRHSRRHDTTPFTPDAGLIAPESGTERFSRINKSLNRITQPRAINGEDIKEFAGDMIKLTGSAQIGLGERVAELRTSDPDNQSAIILHEKKLLPDTGMNIIWKDKEGEVTTRLVVGRNFADTIGGDHPAVSSPYKNFQAPPDINADQHRSLKETYQPAHPVTLFEDNGQDREFSLNEHGRQALVNVFARFMEAEYDLTQPQAEQLEAQLNKKGTYAIASHVPGHPPARTPQENS